MLLFDIDWAPSPRAVVPALMVPGEAEALPESGAICRYPPLFGRTPIEVGRVADWTRIAQSQGYVAAVNAARPSAAA